MKRYILFLLFIFPSISNSQTTIYHPFPNTNTTWVYVSYGPLSYLTYYLNGDTVLSSVNYKKIYFENIYAGAIREINKIVYFIPDTSSSEYELYNFNHGLNDTIANPYGGAICSNDTVVVYQMDSILTSDGYHKSLIFDYAVHWIEGVGSTSLLLEPCNILCFGGGYSLECMLTDSGFSYPPNLSSCIASTQDKINFKRDVSISPNPFNSKSTFTINLFTGIFTLKVFDLLGKIRRNETILYHNKYEFERQELESGIYFLQILLQNDEMLIKKIIIE